MEKYKGRIIVGNAKEEFRDIYVIFATSNGGYKESYSEGIDELVNDIRDYIREEDYTIDDVQNGPKELDAVVCSHYLSSFPALEQDEFDGLVSKLKDEELSKV